MLGRVGVLQTMPKNIFRAAVVRYNEQLVGHLRETSAGFEFVYDPDYLQSGQPISVSLPLRREPFEAEQLFAFFRGLLPEGWYLDIVSKTAKVDTHDLFGVLLATAKDNIGAVTVHQEETETEETQESSVG